MSEEAAAVDGGVSAEDGSGSTADIRDPGVDNDAGGQDSPAPLGPPEWLPEKFWKDGEVNAEALAKSYTHLESKLGKQHDVPEEYAKPEDVEVNYEAPIFQEFTKDAKELGLSQDQFNSLVAKYGPNLGDPQAAELAESQRLEAEYKALGPDADKRIDGLLNWGKNNLGKEDAAVLERMLTEADFVRVLERMSKGSRDASLPRRVEGISQGLDATKLREMATARDANGNRRMAVDPQYRRDVERAYAELYGTQPAESIVTSIGG